MAKTSLQCFEIMHTGKLLQIRYSVYKYNSVTAYRESGTFQAKVEILTCSAVSWHQFTAEYETF